MTVGFGTTAVLLLVAKTFTTWPDSPTGPGVMPEMGNRVAVVVFSRTAGGFPANALSVGAWFTGLTVTVNDCETWLTRPLAVRPSSVTVTVITAVPVLPGGVKVSGRVVLGLE